jgi:hypothetical protein
VEEEVTWERRGELSSFTMDIVVKTDLLIEYLVDVTIINPGATDKLVEKWLSSSFVAGHAAEQSDTKKRSQAHQCLSPLQRSEFNPYSVETTGRTGNSADALMDAMEQCYKTRMGDGAPGQSHKIKSVNFMELGMTLARREDMGEADGEFSGVMLRRTGALGWTQTHPSLLRFFH